MSDRKWLGKKWLVIGGVVTLLLGGTAYYLLMPRLERTRPAVPTAPPERMRLRRPARRRAQLRVATRPAGAKILVNGEVTGRIAPDFVSLDAGRSHTIRLELDGYEPYEIQVELAAEEARVVEVVLERLEY